MRRTLALGHLRGREAAALVVDGRLEDLLIETAPGRPVPGTIFRAIPDRPMKGLGGHILRLPEGTAFVRQTRGLAPGRPVLVQVTGHAEDGKAVPVTTRLSLRGAHAVVTPGAPGRNVSRRITDAATRARLEDLAAAASLPDDTGLIIRSHAGAAEPAAVAAEIAALSAHAASLATAAAGPPARLLAGPGPHAAAELDWPGTAVEADDGALARHGVEDALETLLRSEVALPGGGRMTIEPTRALVAVDVDTGADTSPAAALKADIAAARALPRELRCRGLGGQIVVDFAPVPRRDRQRIEQALAAALRHDPIETTVAGWTPLSHMELRRQRIRLPLAACLR